MYDASSVSLCAHHPRSNLPPPYIWFPLPFYTCLPTSVWPMSFCLLFLFVHLLLSVLYLIYKWIIWFLTFSVWLILLSRIFSGYIHVVANGSITSFPMADSIHHTCVPHLLYPVIFIQSLHIFTTSSSSNHVSLFLLCACMHYFDAFIFFTNKIEDYFLRWS